MQGGLCYFKVPEALNPLRWSKDTSGHPIATRPHKKTILQTGIPNGRPFFQLNTNHYFSQHRPSRPLLPISQFVHMCVFTFEVLFKRLFAPISQSGMSKKFRDSESLGKSNGKKSSHI